MFFFSFSGVPRWDDGFVHEQHGIKVSTELLGYRDPQISVVISLRSKDSHRPHTLDQSFGLLVITPRRGRPMVSQAVRSLRIKSV